MFWCTRTQESTQAERLGEGLGHWGLAASDSLECHSLFNPRHHRVPARSDRDPRKPVATGVDEQIELRTPKVRIGGGACAIRLDRIRGGVCHLTSRSIPVIAM